MSIAIAHNDTSMGGLVERIRDVLIRCDVRESRSSDEPGVFLVDEARGQAALHFNDPEIQGIAIRAASFERGRSEMLTLCGALAGSGYTVTLHLSPRTLSLHVRAG